MELVVLSQNDCAPCKVLKNFLTREGVEFTEVNLSNLPHLAEHYSVMSTPVTVLEEDGEEIARVHGFVPEDIMELAENI